jgi:hypothetical protein
MAKSGNPGRLHAGIPTEDGMTQQWEQSTTEDGTANHDGVANQGGRPKIVN